MRHDVPVNKVIRAVSLAIEAKFNRGDWLDLALMTNTMDQVKGHRRLLRSLEWGDPDYRGQIIEIVPVILGARHGRPLRSRAEAGDVFPNLAEVEEYLNLQAWLEEHDSDLHRDLYAGEEEAALDELQSAAAELGLPDVDEHAVRIRRGLRDDPAQAIGSSKELLETVMKAVLGLHWSRSRNQAGPTEARQAGQYPARARSGGGPGK